jgi:hypothetical protein
MDWRDSKASMPTSTTWKQGSKAARVQRMSAVLNDGPSPSVAMVQAESDACYRMPAKAFRDEIDRRGRFYELLTRYAHALAWRGHAVHHL